jgi:hypothetical protein
MPQLRQSRFIIQMNGFIMTKQYFISHMYRSASTFPTISSSSMVWGPEDEKEFEISKTSDRRHVETDTI